MGDTMASLLLNLLPPRVQAAVRRTFVPPHIRTLLANLPDPILMEARVVEDGDAIPVTARQLIKLGLSTGSCRLQQVVVVPHRGAVELGLFRGGRFHAVKAHQLEADLGTVVKEVLQGLFHPSELPDLLEKMAFQTSTLATLQTITRHMLSITEEDRALYIMLAGITAGYSLGFNRAVLFTPEGAPGRYVGSKAIGPVSAEEAHRVWEAIEVDEKSIEDVIQDQHQAPVDSPFQRRVQSLSFEMGHDPLDELGMAFRSDGPVLFQQAQPNAAVLRDLGARDEYLVAVVRTRRRAPSLVFADNLYTHHPITPMHLRFFRFFMDQTALVWENLLLLREVELLARVDSLTGLLNRREFGARVAVESARVVRGGRSCALLVIDLDFFKQVNDERGHEAGDDALRTLGRLLKETLRGTDIVGRWGGDEFVVFLPDVAAPDLRITAERVGTAAAAAGISLSVGGVMYPRDSKDPGALFGLADKQLYEAKRGGRGRACLPGEDVILFRRPAG